MIPVVPSCWGSCWALPRRDHLLGRMGGDEFMVVAGDVSPAEVGPLVDGLIAAISCEPYDLSNGNGARVGASIGFACLPEDAASAVELRVRADEALYAAKQAGKGVSRRYGEHSGCDTPGSPGAGTVRSPFVRLEPRRALRWAAGRTGGALMWLRGVPQANDDSRWRRPLHGRQSVSGITVARQWST